MICVDDYCINWVIRTIKYFKTCLNNYFATSLCFTFAFFNCKMKFLLFYEIKHQLPSLNSSKKDYKQYFVIPKQFHTTINSFLFVN